MIGVSLRQAGIRCVWCSWGNVMEHIPGADGGIGCIHSRAVVGLSGCLAIAYLAAPDRGVLPLFTSGGLGLMGFPPASDCWRLLTEAAKSAKS